MDGTEGSDTFLLFFFFIYIYINHVCVCRNSSLLIKHLVVEVITMAFFLFFLF